MYKFSNPKLALKIIDEIIIPGHFPYYVNLYSDEYAEDEVDDVLDKVLESPIINVDRTGAEETITIISPERIKLEEKNGDVLLSAEVVDWNAYDELKKNVGICVSLR